MTIPTKIATWCLIVFFLLTALAAFIGFQSDILTGIVALAAAIFLFLDK